MRLMLTAAALAGAAMLAACQQSAPDQAEAPTPAPSAPPVAAEAPPADDNAAEMPANWTEAGGPGAASITVEEQGQRISLECSRRDSEASGAPGRVSVSAAWPKDQSPPRVQDVSLILAGAGFRDAPLWSKEDGRDHVSIQLAPTAELLAALKEPTGLRVVAGDWFISVAADGKGVVKRFADTCSGYVRP